MNDILKQMNKISNNFSVSYLTENNEQFQIELKCKNKRKLKSIETNIYNGYLSKINKNVYIINFFLDFSI